MYTLRKEDLSLHHYLKNVALKDFIEEEKEVSLSLLSSISTSSSYVYEAVTSMEPLPTSVGRGWSYIDNYYDTTQQSGSVSVYDSGDNLIDDSNYIVDYIDGRIIFSSSAIIPSYVNYKWHYISLVDEWPLVEAAGVPVVSIGISRFNKEGFQLGGGKYVSRRVELNIFASNRAERDDVAEVLYDSLFRKGCAYQEFSKGTMLDWDGTWNDSYLFTTVSGVSRLKFNDTSFNIITPPLINISGRDSIMLSEMNRYRSRINFDMFHWDEELSS